MSGVRGRGIELRGALTALVTPMDERGNVDLAALARLVDWQVAQGIDGLVPCGTTGEGATLGDDEQRQVVETVVTRVAGRVPVIAGCGSNDTRRTEQGARRAAQAGADGLLVVSPYYNKPNRSGILAHFGRVAEATELPIVAYNVPGRTGQNLGTETILALAEIPGIVAVKEAAADLDQLAAILAARPAGFAVLSGDDALALCAMALGAEGVISVVSNEAPAEVAELARAALDGDFVRARELHFRLLPLMRFNFLESNPVPVKLALSLLGHCRETARLPLGPPAEATRRAAATALSAARIAIESR